MGKHLLLLKVYSLLYTKVSLLVVSENHVEFWDQACVSHMQDKCLIISQAQYHLNDS